MGETDVHSAQDRPLHTNCLDEKGWLFVRQVAGPCVAGPQKTTRIRRNAAKMQRGSWTRKGRLFMLVATPFQDGTAHLDAENAPRLPEAARRESVDRAVVQVAEVWLGIRRSCKYRDIWR